MKIGLYDPYLDTLGGGERFMLTVASCLAKSHDVTVFWDDTGILVKGQEKFNIKLSNLTTSYNIFSSDTSIFKRFFETKNYDAIIFLSDGSIPFLFSRKNILLFQFPVNWVHGKSLSNQLKLKKINKIICYSDFVKAYLDKTFGIPAHVVYPPVEQITAKKGDKENIILTVGRFTQGMNTKKQEILIDIFKDMYDKGLKKWKLVLAGSYLPTDKSFVSEIEKRAKGYPIEVAANVSFKTLTDYYQKAKIYWHAAGYGEDLQRYPEKAEHFGITTVEAMSAGAVPVVINAGGQKEIVGDNGFLWETLGELEKKTIQLIENKPLWEKMSTRAALRAKDFTTDIFCEKIHDLIEK